MAGSETQRTFLAFITAWHLMCFGEQAVAEDLLLAPGTPVAEAKEWLDICGSQSDGSPRYCIACLAVGGTTANSTSPRGFCLATEVAASTDSVTHFAAADDLAISEVNYFQTPEAALAGTGGGSRSVGRCRSAGSSAATPDAESSFCLAGDLRLADGVPVAVALANGAPITGFQFMQISFQKSSAQGSAGPGPTACQSLAGAKTFTPSGGGFCIAAHLATSSGAYASFTAGNEHPVAGLQLLQVNFDGSGSPSSLPSVSGAKCFSRAGAEASAGENNGFCLAADLNTAGNELASLSFGNRLPVKNMQFVQMTFATNNDAVLDKQIWASEGSSAGNCVSSKGSAASTGTSGGFCLASDLDSVAGTVDIAIANGLSISSLQLVQVTFDGASRLANVTTDAMASEGGPLRAKCQTVGGTKAIEGSPDGFCIASDRGQGAAGTASLALANYLPVATLQFLQIPLGSSDVNDESIGSPPPRGLLVSERGNKREALRSQPAVASAGMKAPRYYSFSPRSGRSASLPAWKTGIPRSMSFWINRKVRTSFKKGSVKR